MKYQSLLRLAIASAAIVSLPSFSPAKPGGTYRGTAATSTLTITGGTPMALGSIPIKIKLPRRKGRLRGTLSTTKIAPPAAAAAADVPISGRIKKSKSLRGGKKHVLRGVWVFDFVGAGMPVATPASGALTFTIKGSGAGYTLKTKSASTVTGPGPPPFTYSAVVTAKK